MSDNFILRWEIDNAALATGKAESEVFDEGGFKWTAAVERSPEEYGYGAEKAAFTLRCGVDHEGPWKCDVKVDMRVFDFYGQAQSIVRKSRFCFNEKSDLRQCGNSVFWSQITSGGGYTYRNKAIVEFNINIITSDRGGPIVDSTKFTAPSEMSNVVLTIGDKKLHVSKEYLAVQSSFFKGLFFGEFAEKGKEEVELKDVVYEEFLDLLNVLYFETAGITDRTLPHILKLADQFQMERLLDLSKKHLTESKGFDVVTKLRLADQYRFTSLKDHCLKSFTTATDLLAKLKSSPKYDNFSEGLKATICDRLVKL